MSERGGERDSMCVCICLCVCARACVYLWLCKGFLQMLYTTPDILGFVDDDTQTTLRGINNTRADEVFSKRNLRHHLHISFFP